MQKTKKEKMRGKLVLENGDTFEGEIFGYKESIAGEVVFNTGMVGYPETLTDPSYKGQILVLTFPLIGNYGVPPYTNTEEQFNNFESDQIHLQGLILSEVSFNYSHWNEFESLSNWLVKNKVPGLYGIDTRKLTKIIREKGTMLGKIVIDNAKIDFTDPNKENLVDKVSPKSVTKFGKGDKKILLVDCGCKNNIVKNLLRDNTQVIRVPWNYDFTKTKFDGVVISNGPGDPALLGELVNNVKKILDDKKPILGICMGHQVLAQAAEAKTYKLKYGHRSQNQPVRLKGTNRCFVTSQNHSYAVDDSSLSKDWEVWFENLNDNTNEGIKHKTLPYRSVQFHPEAAPGPVDTSFIFEEFIKELN